MALISVIGAQWGDEDKEKIINTLLEKVSSVVRYQGGDATGHLIVKKGFKHSLNTIPLGIFDPKIKNVIANGMVINPASLIEEIEKLYKQGYKVINLHISERAHVVMPYHIIMDEIYEQVKGARKTGTTKKGIGPAYIDKVSRDGIRVIDLYDDLLLKNLIIENLKIKNIYFKAFNKKELEANKIFLQYKKYREKIKQYVSDTSILLNNEIKLNKNILFESSQGALYCLEHGTYPFVTSSSPTSSQALVGSGIGPDKTIKTIGVIKPYNTRVGNGVFPTEMIDKKEAPLQNYLRENGNEYDFFSGRQRRIGWLDLVALKHVIRSNGVNYLGLTSLNTLTGLKTIKICTHYSINGKKTDILPSSEKMFKLSKPIYIELNGWEEDILAIKSFDDLPNNAKILIKKIEELSSLKVAFLSMDKDSEKAIELIKVI